MNVFISLATALFAKQPVHFNKCFLSTYYVSDPVLDMEVSDPSSDWGLGL